MNVQNIDDETQFILDKFREGNHTMDLNQLLKNYLENYTVQTQHLVETNEYKPAYYIFKRMEKVLMVSIKNFGMVLEGSLLSYKEIVFNMLDTSKQLGPTEKTTILKHPVELSKAPLRQTDGMSGVKESYEFFKLLMRTFVCILNNIGVIYVMRKKFNESSSYFARAVMGRMYDFDSYVALYQAALIETNVSFACKQQERYDEAGHFLNKAILGFEVIEKISAQARSHSTEITLHGNQMMSLLEILYNKLEKKLVPLPREIQREKIIYTLVVSYHYYGELLKNIGKTKESEFCFQQYDQLQQLFFQLNPKAAKVILQTPEMDKVEEQVKKQEKEKDTLSQVSFKSMKTGTTAAGISKDKIVFQKYIELNRVRFKVIIAQLSDVACVQIMLYSKPLNFLKKMVIAYPDLLAYAQQKDPKAFTNDYTLENFFKSLIKKLYIHDDQLHIKEIDHFTTIEEYMIFLNQMQ